MAQAGLGKIVAVTGASGYVAGEVIHQLLAKGYTVRGTVRSLQDPVKTQHLKDTFKGLELFEADLLKPSSFDECFKGCHAVMHTASPFLTSWTDPQKDLIDPAVNGTKNVLASVEKHLDTIKVVVVTSSSAAIVAQEAHLAGPDKVWTESDWNTTSTLSAGPYRLSKYLAEKAAWDWSEGKPVRLVTVCPTFVLGPPHSSRADSTSVSTVIGFLDGSAKKTGTNPTCFGAVDVRDVGAVHVACLENASASGRYQASSPTGITPLELATMLQSSFGEKYPLPQTQNGEVTHRPLYGCERVTKELGIPLTPISKSMVDMANALIGFGLIKQ